MSNDIKAKYLNTKLPAFTPKKCPYGTTPSPASIAGESLKASPTLSFYEPSFQRIEANHYPFNHYRVHSLLQLLKKTQHFELSAEETKLATFFVADNGENEVYGGAVLLKKRALPHKNKVAKVACQNSLWACSFTLHLPNKDPLYMSSKRLAFCRQFYKRLYDSLITFGQDRKISFLWCTLDAEEANCVEGASSLPFIFKIQPKDSTEGLFQGLLSLDPKIAKTFITPQKSSLPSQSFKKEGE